VRVTQSYMMEQAAVATSSAQSKVATASAEVTSGVRVNVPSDDLVGWEQGQRAGIRAAESTQRGTAITLATGKLQSTDGALSSISDALTTARSLANEMANGTLNAPQRQAAAVQVQALHDSVLASMNSLGSDGKPLFAGSQTGTPFSSSDVYSGDGVTQSVEISEGHSQSVGVSGTVFTASAGVDILGTLTGLVGALNSNSAAGIQTSIANLTTATTQIASAQGDVGSQEAALTAADSARSTFETNLAKVQSDSVGADTVTAASTLAQAQNGLNAAETVAQLIQQLAQKTIS
jgi:flagellar hook-associated protein 3 FlgL